MIRSLVTPLAMLSALALAGCSAQGPEITGLVTLDGRPVDGVRLTFEPLETQQQLGAAVVVSGPDGVFRVEPRPDTGLTLKPGKYGVGASRKTDAQGGVPSEADYGQFEAAGQLRESVAPKFAVQPGVPPALTAEIAPGKNELKFELTSR